MDIQQNLAHTSREKTASRLKEITGLQSALISSPWSRDVLELAMATVVAVATCIRSDTPLVWLFIVGAPSSGKTDAVLLMKGSKAATFIDSLTPESFVSGARHSATGRKAKDLLPELDGKCLVIKDVTTMLSLRDDKVRKILGDLQSIYDGEFAKGTGTQFEDTAVIRYQSRFGILGCVTPDAYAKHQRYLGQIGNRFLCYRVPPLTEEQQTKGFDQLRDGEGRREKRERLRMLVAEHLDDVLSRVDTDVTIPYLHDMILRSLAFLVQRGRTPIHLHKWFDPHVGDGGRWRAETAVGAAEGPFRVYEQLRTLLGALTVVNGRAQSTWHEVELVRRVALSSVLADRAEVLEHLNGCPVVRRQIADIELDGQREQVCVERSGTTVAASAAAIHRSEDQARNRLDEMVAIGLLVRDRGRIKDGRGRPQDFYRPGPDFEDAMLGAFESSHLVWQARVPDTDE